MKEGPDSPSVLLRKLRFSRPQLGLVRNLERSRLVRLAPNGQIWLSLRPLVPPPPTFRPCDGGLEFAREFWQPQGDVIKAK